MTNKKAFTLGLIPKLIIAIILGTVVGLYCPEVVTKIAVTFSGIFGKFLNFVIPLMIIAFVAKGIADLSEGAGKLLLVTVGIAYASTLIAGSLSYGMAHSIFPRFISTDMVQKIQQASEKTLEPFFELPLNPAIEVTGALVLAFMIGLCVSIMRTKKSG